MITPHASIQPEAGMVKKKNLLARLAIIARMHNVVFTSLLGCSSTDTTKYKVMKPLVYFHRVPSGEYAIFRFL